MNITTLGITLAGSFILCIVFFILFVKTNNRYTQSFYDLSILFAVISFIFLIFFDSAKLQATTEQVNQLVREDGYTLYVEKQEVNIDNITLYEYDVSINHENRTIILTP